MGRRLISMAGRRRVAARMAVGVLGLQGAVLVAFAVTPGEPPAHGTWWQLLWASSRRPMFYPLAALLLAGPMLTWAAWRVGGVHRRWLVAGWGVFLAIGVGLYARRLDVMLHVLWWQYGG